MKSLFREINPFWVLPYLYKAGDHFFHIFFNSAQDWLSFNNRMINSQLEAMHPMPLLSAIIEFIFNLVSVYVLPCLKYSFYKPYIRVRNGSKIRK